MKTKLLISSICSIFMIMILLFAFDTITIAKDSFNLWLTSVFPSLFPFFVLTSLLRQMKTIELLMYKASKKLDYHLLFTTAIGFICGYPSSSKIIGDNENLNNRVDIYALSTCPSPIFVIGTVCTIYLGNPKFSYYVLPSIYLSLLTSYLFIKLFSKTKKQPLLSRPKISNEPFGILLKNAILDGFFAQFIILGIITMMSIISFFLSKLGIFLLFANIISPVFTVLKIPTDVIPYFLEGMLEMTKGNYQLSTLGISTYHKIVLCTFLTAFGGIAIFTESIAFINNRIKPFCILGIKLLHGILSVFYINIILFLFPITNTVSRVISTYSISWLSIFVHSSLMCFSIYVIVKQL